MRIIKHLAKDRFSYIDNAGICLFVGFSTRGDWASAALCFGGALIVSIVARAVVNLYGR